MKKLALCAIVASFAAIVQANELWWFVDDDVQVDGTAAGEWNALNLYASADDSNPNSKNLVQTVSRDTMYVGEFSRANIDSYSGYSFYVELINSTERVATSAAVSYNDLLLGGAIASSTQSTPTPYQFLDFSSQAVPEPTSGLLMLIGLAGLTLKRKRA